jgi:hypothetical protein
MSFFTNNNLSHYGDIIAIPFFALLSYYFYNIQDKTTFEYVLFYFSIGGFTADSFYTILFFLRKNTKFMLPY